MPTYCFDRQEFSILDLGGDQQKKSTDNVKVGYKANISRDGIAAPYVRPRDEVEELLIGLLKESIGVENIGVLDNFFELGLSSLSASQYAMLIKERIDIDIEIQSIIEAGSISELSEIITKKLLEEKE